MTSRTGVKRAGIIGWTEVHARLYSEYLQVRRWGVDPADAVFENEALDREEHNRGLHRLQHLVPELAPDQIALARLLAETAVLSHWGSFCDPGVVKKARELAALIDGRPAYQSLCEALKPVAESDCRRDDRIRFAVWMTLESNIRATSKTGAHCACSIVGDVLRETGLATIDRHSIANIWKDRSVRKGRGTRRRW